MSSPDWRTGFYLDRMQAALQLCQQKPFDQVVRDVLSPYTVVLLVIKDPRLEHAWIIEISGDCNIFGDDPERVACLIGMCNQDIKVRVVRFDKKKREFQFLCE